MSRSRTDSDDAPRPRKLSREGDRSAPGGPRKSGGPRRGGGRRRRDDDGPGVRRKESSARVAQARGGRSGREPSIEGVPADSIDPARLDRDATRVVTRLQRAGHEAYFVGGCVRDLLIGQRPKDFDVATSASPSEVRRLFRNCRIIGRRFKLAHIYYGDHIIETATFRAAPQEQQEGDDGDLLIVDDNVYGTAEEDARRRDFTVNALFLDPTRHEILDHVGGLADLERRTLRTIGDPLVRFAEDPVRILRAIKFSTRLDLEIDDPAWDAMCDVSPDLAKAAPPRVLEEILRLCRSGNATSAYQMMRDVGALDVLIPQLEEYLGPEDDIPERAEPFWDLLEALDDRVKAPRSREPQSGLLISLLFVLPFELALAEAQDGDELLDGRARAEVAWEVLQPLSDATRLSRKDFARARRVLVALQNFTSPPERFSDILFARSEEFEEALELFGLLTKSRGESMDVVMDWKDRQKRAVAAGNDELDVERRKSRKRRRRKRRRRDRA